MRTKRNMETSHKNDTAKIQTLDLYFFFGGTKLLDPKATFHNPISKKIIILINLESHALKACSKIIYIIYIFIPDIIW